MSRLIGAVLGLTAFAAVAALGGMQGMGFGAVLWRAVAAFAVGALLGGLVFGPVGESLVKQSLRDAAAGTPEPVPEKPSVPEPPKGPSGT